MSNEDGPSDLLDAIGESESKGSKTELLFLAGAVEPATIILSLSDLSWDSRFTRVYIGPRERSAF